MNKIRVLLVDDHAVLRAGLRALINVEPDMEVVGEAENGQGAIEQTQRLLPNVVVMDIAMPGMNGLEATRRIRDLNLDCKVLFLTMHAAEEYLLQVLRAGGSGYVLKQSADTELMEAIRIVSRDEAFLYPSATKMLMEDYLRRVTSGEEQDSYEKLSEREREVLKLTAAGFTNQEIAERFTISSKTVDTYRQRIMDKLNLRHRSELVQYALKKGLLEAE